MLKLGYIDYLNCVPFFHSLREAGFTGEIIRGVPSELNRLLREGQIDACPSSSFEYGVNWRRYLLLPGFSISAAGPVGSVLLFSPVPPDRLAGVPIALTGESATSINLLRILLPEFYGTGPVEDYVPTEAVEDLIAQGRPALLIGDRALKAAQQASVGTVYDLGDLWFRHTGLPFVFALWMVRQQVAESDSDVVVGLIPQLEKSLARTWNNLSEVAERSAQTSFMAPADIEAYWKTMSFSLGEEHRQGLTKYFALCVKHGLLPEEPPLRFVPPAEH